MTNAARRKWFVAPVNADDGRDRENDQIPPAKAAAATAKLSFHDA